MPGPVRYTKSGKVKKAAPRKYETGKGWSKLTPKEQAAPSVTPTKTTSRKRQVRRAVSAPRSRGDFGRSFQPTPTRRVSAPDTREQNREALGPVGDALATVARALQEPVDLPGTKFDRLGEIMSLLIAPRGTVKGATVKGVSGLRAAIPQREAAKKALVRRLARSAAKRRRVEDRPARRTGARRKRRSRRTDAQGRYEARMEERNDPPWVGKSELRGRIDEMKALRRYK